MRCLWRTIQSQYIGAVAGGSGLQTAGKHLRPHPLKKVGATQATRGSSLAQLMNPSINRAAFASLHASVLQTLGGMGAVTTEPQREPNAGASSITLWWSWSLG